jgi:hypothetical protein
MLSASFAQRAHLSRGKTEIHKQVQWYCICIFKTWLVYIMSSFAMTPQTHPPSELEKQVHDLTPKDCATASLC